MMILATISYLSMCVKKTLILCIQVGIKLFVISPFCCTFLDFLADIPKIHLEKEKMEPTLWLYLVPMELQ